YSFTASITTWCVDYEYTQKRAFTKARPLRVSRRGFQHLHISIFSITTFWSCPKLLKTASTRISLIFPQMQGQYSFFRIDQ
ncbi:MAG TPA: hypothetical protein VFD03_08455, partial [Clostridia bacterium]|nr:hypothetical protein [Clostridia bacterium]